MQVTSLILNWIVYVWVPTNVIWHFYNCIPENTWFETRGRFKTPILVFSPLLHKVQLLYRFFTRIRFDGTCIDMWEVTFKIGIFLQKVLKLASVQYASDIQGLFWFIIWYCPFSVFKYIMVHPFNVLFLLWD